MSGVRSNVLNDLHKLESYIREVQNDKDQLVRMFELNTVLLMKIRDEIAMCNRHLEWCEKQRRKLRYASDR